MIAIRKSHLALSLGDYATILVDDEKELFGFRRKYGEEEIWVIFNNSDEAHSTRIQSSAAKLISLRADAQEYSRQQGNYDLKLKTKSFLLLKVAN
ncbi:MAG: hypothetical protein DA405_11895 [Bacteroidetes bacterium]|nr:MAG: hypothetical protein DA405_11895 [Bacteroidota bacterium]